MGCWWCYALKAAFEFQIVNAEMEGTSRSTASVLVHHQVNRDHFYSDGFYIHGIIIFFLCA